MASRLIIGASMSLFMTASYSLVTILYKENTQKGIGRIQASIGIGPIVWLIGSSFIFKWFGFFVTFSLLACILVLICIVIFIWINNSLEDDPNSKYEGVFNHLKKSNYIFRDWRIIAAILNAALAMLLIDAPSSLVADRFGEFDLPEYLKGLTFLFSTIPFTIVSLLLHRLTKTSYRAKQIVMWIGWILLSVGFLLIGPSSIFQFPDKVWFILIGFSFFGVSYASLIVSNIPLLQDYAIQYDTVSEEYNKVANYISGLFNVSFGLGACIGPLISPNIKDWIGYKNFTDLFALLWIVWLLIFVGITSLPTSNALQLHRIKSGLLHEKLALSNSSGSDETKSPESSENISIVKADNDQEV